MFVIKGKGFGSFCKWEGMSNDFFRLYFSFFEPADDFGEAMVIETRTDDFQFPSHDIYLADRKFLRRETEDDDAASLAGQVADARSQDFRIGCRFINKVKSFTVRKFLHGIDDICRLSVDDHIGTQFLCFFQTAFDDVEDGDSGPFHLGNLEDDQTDRAGTADEYRIVTSKAAAVCDLGTDGVWFYCRCDFPGKIIGQLIGLAVVGCDVFLEPPIAMDTHDLQAGADIVSADPAGIAMTAGNDRIDGYAVADSYIFSVWLPL